MKNTRNNLPGVKADENAKAIWEQIKAQNDALYEKIDSGTATPEEQEKYRQKMIPYEEMEPNVLYADMPHAEFDKMMREKHAKRLAAEAEAADPKPE